MARIRSIKPEFAAHPKVARLTRDARLTFLLLLPEADDDGRMVGTRRRLIGALYPHDSDVSEKKLGGWIDQLVKQKMVQEYEVDGVKYLRIVGFTDHQKPQHPRPSNLPPPPPIHETDMNSSGDPHEPLTPEGLGSREGVESSSSPPHDGERNDEEEEEDEFVVEAKRRATKRDVRRFGDLIDPESWVSTVAGRLRKRHPKGLPKDEPAVASVARCGSSECVNGWLDQPDGGVEPCPSCNPRAMAS